MLSQEEAQEGIKSLNAKPALFSLKAHFRSPVWCQSKKCGLAVNAANAGKSKYYRYSIGDLREATLLSEGVDNWWGLEDHETFMERLQAEHGRKWSFWKQWSD